MKEIEVEFLGNKIEIKKYPFNNFWGKARTISVNEIDFIKMGTIISSICVNSKEVLFIPSRYNKQLEQFVNQFDIKKTEKEDVWELICYPFVDENITEEGIVENNTKLKSLNFELYEVNVIRKKIHIIMYVSVLFTMNYASLDHYDVLQARKKIYFFNPFYNHFYWWTMKIALKGFVINQPQPASYTSK